MTAQIADSILIEGRSHSLCVLPLEVLFRAMTNRPRFGGNMSSANWRGHSASWKIAGDRLWLTELRGQLEQEPFREDEWSLSDIGLPKDADQSFQSHTSIIARIEALPETSPGVHQSDLRWRGSAVADVNGFVDQELARAIKIATLLRAHTDPVPADWYSGLLRIPMGKKLQYHHAGFLTEHESDLIIEIEAGTVRRQWLIDNTFGFHARKQADEIRKKSLQAVVAPGGGGNEAEYREAIREPVNAAKLSAGSNVNLHDSILYFLRSHFLRKASGFVVMSKEDQEARADCDRAISEMDEAGLAIGMTIGLRRELAADAGSLSELPLSDFAEILLMKTEYCRRALDLMQDLHIPYDDNAQIGWAIDSIQSTEHLVAEGQFALLGAARSIICEHATPHPLT